MEACERESYARKFRRFAVARHSILGQRIVLRPGCNRPGLSI